MLTIVSSPPFLCPAYNPITIQVKSTEQTRTDFKYRFRITDDLGAPLSTIEKFGGSSVDDIITTDVSGILRRRHTFDFWRYNVENGEYIYFATKYKIGFNIYIDEFYSGAVQSTLRADTSASLPIALSSIRFASFDYNSQIKNNYGRWLTNFEQIKLRREDKITTSFLIGVEGLVSTKYNFYNGDTLLASVTKNNPYGTPSKFEDILHFHAGLQDIADYCGVSSDIRANTNRWTISPNARRPLEFIIVNQDCRFPGVRMHYLNEWGGVDSFLFGLAARRSATIEKKKAKLRLTGNPLRPSSYGLGTSPYVVTFSDALKLTSDYLSDADSNALLEMFTSPIVSVETEKNLFFPAPAGEKIILPCDLELSNYDIKQISLDRLFNLELDVKISVDNTRQSL